MTTIEIERNQDDAPIIGDINAIGVMREERIDHVRANVLKVAARIPNCKVHPHGTVAIVVCYGPSLKKTFPLIKRQQKKLGAKLISVSGSHDFLRAKGITPDVHIECDPRAHKGKMIKKRSPDTTYLMASCCHPDVIDMLNGHKIVLWHLHDGPESYKILDIKSEELTTMISGGGSVGLRAISLLYFLGFRNFIIHGMDSSFDGDVQHAGAHSGKDQQTIKVRPAVNIDGVSIKSEFEYTTSPVLISYARKMLEDLRNGSFHDANFYWYGNGLFQEMLRLQNEQMMAVNAKSKDPAFIEPKEMVAA